MTVSELITELKKCNPNDLVMYNFENAFSNDEYERNYGDMDKRYGENRDKITEWDMSVDDVLIGSGTIRGFVFLTEELLE